MSDAHRFPEQERFEKADGTTFSLDVLDSIYTFRDLGEALPEPRTHRDYLKAVRDYMRETHDVELTLAETDWLTGELDVLFAAKKNAQVEALRAASGLKSPSSTPASMPAG